jgi:hypothetical protein
MESEILAGRIASTRQHVLTVSLDEYDEDLAGRAENIQDAVQFVEVGGKRRACVLSSGVDPELCFGPAEEDLEPFDGPIVDEIGQLPELSAPTDQLIEVIEAWENWIDDYEVEAEQVIARLNSDPPKAGWDGLRHMPWSSGVVVRLAAGVETTINPSDGTEAMQAARAGLLWNWACAERFSPESVAAAREAVAMRPRDARRLLELTDPVNFAQVFLEQAKRRFAAAKAHHRARASMVLDFDAEMNRWASEYGSNRLRLGLQDGYRMNGRYLAERLAREAPGMFAMPSESAKKGWAVKASSPTEAALQLRRRIQAAMKRNAPANGDGPPKTEIMTVRRPPHEIYFADDGIETEYGIVGDDLPSRNGWPWRLNGADQAFGGDPLSFEAVVVKNWLGRFHLIGGVRDGTYGSPPGIWAAPNIDDFGAEGDVIAHDPDAAAPNRAKRKPPLQTGAEDDIRF